MKRRSEKGIILVTLLWMLVLLTLMVYQVAYEIRLNKALMNNRISGELLKPAISSALILLTEKFKADGDLMIDHPLEIPFQDNSLSEKELSPRIFMTVNYYRHQASYLHENEIYGMYPENGRLNINSLPKIILERIKESTPFTDEQWACVFDWLDQDSDPNNHGRGAEKDYYIELEEPYKPLDRPITDFSSLYLVKGMTREMTDFIRDHFTVHGNGRVNIHFCSDQVLAWLGFSPSLIDKLNRYYSGLDDIRGTDDDRYFSSVPDLVRELSEFEPLTFYETSQINEATPFLTLESEFFSASIRFRYDSQWHSSIYKAYFLRRGEKVSLIGLETMNVVDMKIH